MVLQLIDEAKHRLIAPDPRIKPLVDLATVASRFELPDVLRVLMPLVSDTEFQRLQSEIELRRGTP